VYTGIPFARVRFRSLGRSRDYPFFVTPISVILKIPIPKSIALSVTPLTQGLSRYFDAVYK